MVSHKHLCICYSSKTIEDLNQGQHYVLGEEVVMAVFENILVFYTLSWAPLVDCPHRMTSWKSSLWVQRVIVLWALMQ